MTRSNSSRVLNHFQPSATTGACSSIMAKQNVVEHGSGGNKHHLPIIGDAFMGGGGNTNFSVDANANVAVVLRGTKEAARRNGDALLDNKTAHVFQTN